MRLPAPAAARRRLLHPEPHQAAGQARRRRTPKATCSIRSRTKPSPSTCEKVGEPLVKAFGDTPPYAIFSDSLEAYGADWTPNLPDEFKKRRGYDLIPHLPELVAGGTPAADTIRHDYGKTLTELIDENYLHADRRLGRRASHEVPLANLWRTGS